MSKNNSPVLFYCLTFFLLFSRVVFAQQDFVDENKVNESTADTPISLNPPQISKTPLNPNKEHVIAHQKIQNSQLSLNELRSIFSLRARKWPDGTPITVFVLRDEHESHRQFLLKTLKMLPHQLRRQWDRYIYSGIGQGPVVVESQDQMLSMVKATPGGIGYIEGGVNDDSIHLLSIN